MHCWKMSDMRRYSLGLWFILVCLVCLGCGRKLPPLPPAPEEPVIINSIKFVDKAVVVKITCNESAVKLVLLSKPQGICPQCTSDLKQKVEVEAQEGTLQLQDETPEENCMVYRLRLEKGTTIWLSPARIVCK
jgi:hypothetical protein